MRRKNKDGDIMIELTQAERALLETVNGEQRFADLSDEDLIFFLPERTIRETLGNNERAKELIQEKRRILSEF